jgi:hypothetical protein
LPTRGARSSEERDTEKERAGDAHTLGECDDARVIGIAGNKSLLYSMDHERVGEFTHSFSLFPFEEEKIKDETDTYNKHQNSITKTNCAITSGKEASKAIEVNEENN